jgi:DNA-binding beta-propeller fold protein YncE
VRDRPARQRPLIWALLLIAAATVAAMLGLVFGHRSQAPRAAVMPSGSEAPSRAGPTLRPRARARAAVLPAQRALGLPPVAPGPVPGYVLIADRNNNRLLIVSPAKRIVWGFPRPGGVRRGQSFRDPDDAFFAPGYRAISTNEEYNDQVALISLQRPRIVWTYGRAGQRGSAAGELANPDDAYVLPGGQMSVADILNCRVLRLTRGHRIAGEIGSAGSCAHDPPRSLSSPNGAAPLPDGGLLVTEIGGWIDRIDARGGLVWSIRTPTTYPSDAQLLPNGNVLVAGFNTPGRIDILTPRGRVVWTYGPASGPGALDRPSLAVRWPNGMIAVTDDWHHRIVVIDPRTKRIVWQYGHLGIASSAPGYLNKPDGLDLLPATRPTVLGAAVAGASAQPALPVRASGSLVARRVGSLPAATSRAAAVALPGGRLALLGGLVAGGSSRELLIGPPGRLRSAGRLPQATHDTAAALAGGKILLFGGGEAVASSAVVRIDPGSGAARRAHDLPEPLSDLAAVAVGRSLYLVGGYTGTRFASAVLRVGRHDSTRTVARLPSGLRYAGVASLAGRIYVAGGLTASGESDALRVIEPRTGSVRTLGRLPYPVAHAPLVALGGSLYLIGGRNAGGAALAGILRIDPASGRTSPAGRLPGPLADAAAVAIGQHIAVVGGAAGAASTAVLELSAKR